MKADFSRISFDPAQHYSSVLHQQGRIITDADLNEQAAIHKHFLESLAASLTGNEGAIWLDPNGPSEKGRWLAPRPVELRHLPGFFIYQPKEARETGQVLWERKKGGTLDMPGADKSAAEKERQEKLRLAELRGYEDAAGEAEKLAGAEWWISPGHYYAGGLRCENDAWVPVSAQPFLPAQDSALQVPGEPDEKNPALWLFYLDAWERPFSWLDTPRLSDIALGAAVDTAQRAQVVWQVRGAKLDYSAIAEDKEAGHSFRTMEWPVPWNRRQPRLRVRIKPGAVSDDPCRPAFASAWQGQENLLYRVEIHDGTPLSAAPPSPPEKYLLEKYAAAKPGKPEKDDGSTAGVQSVTFKWSRENGSVAAKVTGTKGAALVIFPGQLKASGFRKGDRVEVVKNDDELTGRPGRMFIVSKVQGDCVSCEADAAGNEISETAAAGDKLRRWDQKPCGGTVMAVAHEWVELEHGIEVLFEPAAGAGGHDADGKGHVASGACFDGTEFRTGDYWTFTARTATAAVDWPLETLDEVVMEFGDSAQAGDVDLLMPQTLPPVPVRLKGLPAEPADDAPPAALPPHGVRHRYALLACALPELRGEWRLRDLRRILHLCDEPQPQRVVKEPALPEVKPEEKPQEGEVLSGLTAAPPRSVLDVLKNVTVTENPKTKAIREVKVAVKEADTVRSAEAAKVLEEKLVSSSLLKGQGGVVVTPAAGGKAVKKSAGKKGKPA
jgi:hypothetical protein